jgi:Methylmalonic aciduria and homocystinuria type D protein
LIFANLGKLILLVLKFIDFARDICEKICAQGYWADFIDPCSGLPMITTDCNKVILYFTVFDVESGYTFDRVCTHIVSTISH